MQQLQNACTNIAYKYRNEEYFIPISRLSDFETKGVIPSIYRLYSLAVIYHTNMRELLGWYGIDINIPVSELELSSRPKCHLSDAIDSTQSVRVPVKPAP